MDCEVYELLFYWQEWTSEKKPGKKSLDEMTVNETVMIVELYGSKKLRYCLILKESLLTEITTQ